MTIKLWSAVAAACVLAAGCQRQPAGLWIHHDIVTKLDVRFDGKFTNKDLWRDHETSIATLPNFQQEEDLSHRLVMVTFPAQSSLGISLRQSGDTLLHFSGDAQRSGFALVKADDQEALDRLAQQAHAAHANGCGHLQLLSGFPLADPSAVSLVAPVYAPAVSVDAVGKLLPTVDAALISRLETTIHKMEALGTRFHSSESGAGVPAMVQQLFSDAVGGRLAGITHQQVGHKNTTQKSLIVTIPGSADPEATGPVVIIGAHLDSINKTDHAAAAPGADDDASGIATLVEIARQMAEGRLQFQRTIELHAYAAEEVGLVGSGEIAASYRSDGRQVAGMLQLDMDSWAANPTAKTIYLVENDTSFTLSRYAKALMTNYMGGDYVSSRLASGTSDHRTWHNAGYPTVFPFEDPHGYNEALHTAQDTSTTSNNRALTGRFVQLCLAFLAHEAGLAGVEADYQSRLADLKANSSKDLKLAVRDSGTAGSYFVSVAASAAVNTVELCITGAAGDLGCTKEMANATHVDATGGRAFYSVGTALTIAKDSHLAVYGYDAADKLIALRTIKLTGRL